jgi:hypothetical protein
MPRPQRQVHGITIERYGELMAHIQHFPVEDSPEVLGRLDVRVPDWEAAKAHWSAHIAFRAAAGDDGPFDAMAAAYQGAAQQLQQDRPCLESLGPKPSERRAAAEQAAEQAKAEQAAVDPAGPQPPPPVVLSPPPLQPSAPAPPPPVPHGFVAPRPSRPAESPFPPRGYWIQRVPLEHYAALSAELAVTGDSARALWRGGLRDEQELGALQAAWSGHLEDQPQLRPRYEALRAHFASHFERERLDADRSSKQES